MRNYFSKLGTQVPWRTSRSRGATLALPLRYLSALLILLTLSIGQLWAADPDLAVGATAQTSSTFLGEYSTQGITLSSSASYSSGAVQLGNTPSSYDQHYFEVLSSSAEIEKVSFLISGNGSNKSIQAPVFAWASTATGNTADTYVVLGAVTVTANSYAAAKWFEYDLSAANVKCARIYRTTKNISSTDPAYTGSSTALGSGQTIKIYGVKVWLKASSTKHTVTYKLNGGTGTTPTQADVAEGAKFTLHDGTTGITPVSGKEFAGWNDGTSTFAGGAEYTMGTSNVTLTAQWQDPAPKYAVTYVLNGPSGDAPTQASVAAGTSITLASAPTWAGHAFDGWLCSADAAVKAAGSSYTMTAANTTFTAQWHEVDCKIYSLTGGIGSAVVQQANATVNDGVSLILSNSDGIIKLSPASGSFNAGDIVTISGTVGNTTKEFGVKISNAADKKATLGTASVAGTTNPMVATATLSAASDYLYICRTGGTTQTILTCEVHRACAEGTVAGLSYAEAEVNKTEGDAAFTNPLTNANSLVLDGYKSSKEEVATVNFSTGEVTIVGAGSATITANSAVQTKAGTLYAAGTASYTLTVAALPKYHVTYDLNGGSGEVAEADHKAGEKFTLHDGVTGVTAPGSKTFVNWKDQDDALFDGGVEYTMPAKDVTLTAQWAGDVYTVKFMDGETVLDTKVVEVGSHPTDIEHPTKPLSSFAAWQLSGSDVNLDEVSGTKDAIVTLTARWTKVYAQDADLEGLVESEGTSADWQAYMSGKGYAYSTSGVSLDAKNPEKTFANWPYQGLKAKEIGAYVEGRIAADKLVIIKLGHMAAAANVSLDGVAAGTATGLDADEPAGQLNYFYVENESVLRYETTNGGACVLKAITITNPFQVTFNANGGDPVASQYGHPAVTLPDASNGTKSLLGWFDAAEGGNKIGDVGESYTPAADIELFAQWEDVSTDARLASITLDPSTGVWEPAFDPEVTNYTYTMPYGTAAVPTITGATSVNANAKAPVIDAQAANWGDVAHIHGVAQSDDTKDYYITMKIEPKDGVSIIKVATTGGTNKTVTGLYAGDGDVNLSSSKKMDNGKYIGFTLDGTTLQAGDRINVHTTTAANTGGSHIIFYDNMTDKTELYETGEIGGLGDNIFEINAAMIGSATAYVYRSNADAAHQWNGYVDFIEVTRAMNPVLTAITIDGRDGEIDALDDKHFSVTIPYEADLAALTVVPTIVRNAAHPTTPEAVISNEGAWILGDNTYRIMDKDGDYTDYTITLTRDVKKYTVKYYDGSTVLGTEDVEDGNHPTAAGIPVPVKFGSTFAGWSESDGGAVVELSDITISAVKDLFAKYEVIPCPTSGTVYKFEIKDGLASENLPIATDMDMSSYIDATGIGLLTYSATANNKATINSDGTIQLKDATAAYLKVELACALAAGDQIRAHVSNNPIRVQVGATYDSSKDLILDKNAYDIVDITAAMEGLKVLYIARSTNGNANLADFEIYRRPELTGASMEDFTLGVGQSRTPNLILEPSPDAIVNSEEWVITATTNLTGAAINPTTGEITTGTLDDESIDGSISVKVTLNGTIEPTCTVTVVKAYPQANVEESMLWDWSASCWAGKANTEMTGEDRDKDLLMANTGANIVNSSDFRSDMLIVNGQYAWRTEGTGKEYFQGNSIKFTTTVAGAVRVYFRSTGSSKTIEVSINGTVAGSHTGTFDWSDYVEVPAGEVAIVGTGDGYTRIQKIEFLALVDRREGSWVAPRELGTVCLESDAMAVGASVYELVGCNENGYMAFDEILSGEIEAGKPYLFEANRTGNVSFYAPVSAGTETLAKSTKGMYGTFEDIDFVPGSAEAENIYYFSGRSIWKIDDFTVAKITVPAYRCYVNYAELKENPVPAVAPAPGRRRVVLGVNGKDAEQTATALDNLNADEAPRKVMIDGQLFIIRGEKMFDATGRLVK